jgi:hypothetical protein
MTIAWGDLGLVLIVGLAAGAGLVAIFALGVAALAGPAVSAGSAGSAGSTARPGGDEPTVGPSPVGRIIGYACFTIVAAAVAYGIYLAIPSLHKIF